MNRGLILASTSPYRRKLLGRLGVSFRCVAPDVDEETEKRRSPDPTALAERLAAAKAGAVATRFPFHVVIGCDQVAAVGGAVLGKPGTMEQAAVQLDRLAGRTHELVTAVCVRRVADDVQLTHTNRARLTMRTLSAAERDRYLELDRPTDCAGSYKIESAGIALFERVESDDFTAITGLPLMAVAKILRELGFAAP